VCGPGAEAKELYPATLPPEAFSPAVFSARRLPDRLHYRVVRCGTCGLVRSDPIAEPGALARLYEQSRLNYAREASNLRQTYGRYLDRLMRHGGTPGTLLEIGCGNGFLLEEALIRGYREVCGVEPSRDAVEKASPQIRPHLVCDVFRPGLFSASQFDVIGMFQVLDHLSTPGEILAECFRILRPGGLVLVLNHNVASWSARMLGARSPIVDVEHTFLYSPETLRRLFERNGFQVVDSCSVWNRYTLQYLAELTPLPALAKRFALRLLSASRVGRIAVTLPLGNLCQIARKPNLGSSPHRRFA
jgi:SAM-dependent methyltransferase